MDKTTALLVVLEWVFELGWVLKKKEEKNIENIFIFTTTIRHFHQPVEKSTKNIGIFDTQKNTNPEK